MEPASGVYTIEKIEDADFIDSADSLGRLRDEAIEAFPHLEEQIRADYQEKMARLLEWWEYERVEWTVTEEVPPW